MNKTYVSTRNHQDQINFYQAIVQGIGDDGGLLVPNFDFQKLDLNKLCSIKLCRFSNRGDFNFCS